MENRQDSARVKSYQDLKVWKLAMDTAEKCYIATRSFPRDEIFGLTSQIRRSASSVAANIAEGFGRENRGSFAQFLRIAQGSLKELETHIMLAARVGLMKSAESRTLLDMCDENGKMLGALIRTVRKNS